ncbi:GSCOCG00007647001-RA-CDS [Cotesia congregata]|uniref:Similar to noc4l-b: Nucleolar complex protein 4 homolog B (Xenopus laevis) n=1 Tax=Cotesia congregata TaxID=51543 RepID=A0A8J2MLV3_COTCN|nr:GSCOCG00007647001-RA-CDS [Cotesia congregata]CAG5096987.1 Similar to noc4l-b: Nucleolar complex protein 4 homolog B (Xenopus laevis) [Cotesia congregata]
MAAIATTDPGDNSQFHRTLVKQFRNKAMEFLSSKKYANNLFDILSQWKNSTNLCMITLETIFLEVLRRDYMYLERTIAITISEPSPEIKYINWLREYYEETWSKTLSCFESDRTVIQNQALTTAINMMAQEGKHPIDARENHAYFFPVHRLKSILMALLSPDQDNTHLISKFEETLEYKDALYYTLKTLPSLTPKRQPHKLFIKNLLELINRLALAKENAYNATSENQKLLCHLPNSPVNFTWDQSSAKKSLNKVWGCIMHWELTPQLHKLLLIVLVERVIQHLEKPILLTDFLMDSLDVDGPIGVLALKGVYELVTKHNLEYPNIFTKLYAMFEPEIFHTKYKARLFYLSDLFLQSTHLPEALVAAFIKRLARLTLVAPPEDIMIILEFIGNLLLRHPGLKCLIDHPHGGELSDYPGVGDPFLMEERDPLQSNALLSSLWEIRALQHHVLPSIATKARFINNPLSSKEHDVTAALDNTGEDIFNKEIKDTVKDIMLTFERPHSMSLPKGERLFQYWQL